MSAWTATLTGRIPSKKNSRQWIRTSSGQRLLVPSEAHRAWENDAGYQIKSFRPAQVISGPFTVTLVFTRPSRARWADLDNQITTVLDLLQKMEIVVNDRDAIGIHADVVPGPDWSVTMTITVSSVVWDQEAA